MFKITKFVIAAALTAIIAAPIMAQEDECPCWTEDDLNYETFVSEKGACITRDGIYIMLVGQNRASGRLEQAQVSQNSSGVETCFYQTSEATIFRFHNVTENQFNACFAMVSLECEKDDR